MWKNLARVIAHGAVALGVLAVPAAAGPVGDLLITGLGPALITVSAAGETSATITRMPLSDGTQGWSPDGTRIAFESSSTAARTSSIFVANADGSDLRALAHAGPVAERPVWISPSELAYRRRDSSASTAGTLWIVALEDGVARQLVASDGYPRAMQPNGTFLLYTTRASPPLLALVDVHSGVTRRLRADVTDAAWSPDGRELALAGPTGLELVRADGTERRRLVGIAGAGAPSWSPEGDRIVFTVRREFPELYGKLGLPTRTEIWTVGADGRALKLLTGIAGDRPYETVDQWGSAVPSWWPDGSRLFFRSQRASEPGDNWMMNADGTCEQRWPPHLRVFSAPQWRPGAKPASSRLDCLSVTVRLRQVAPPGVPLHARGPDTAELGARDPLPLRVVVRNDGTRPVRDLRLTLTGTHGSLAVPTHGCGHNVVCELGPLDPAEEVTLNVEARGRAGLRAAALGTFTATARYADTPDLFPADDTASAFVKVLPCDVLGTWRNDRLVGTRRGERICGRPGYDRIDGGPGNDRIDGGSGGDSITGGSGRDTIFGAGGADTIRVRDGQRDSVRCGPQADSVVADRIDRIASDCERIGRS